MVSSAEVEAEVLAYDARPVITPILSEDRLTLKWSGAATLQSAADATGTFVDVPGIASPHVITNFDNGAQYYRLRVP